MVILSGSDACHERYMNDARNLCADVFVENGRKMRHKREGHQDALVLLHRGRGAVTRKSVDAAQRMT